MLEDEKLGNYLAEQLREAKTRMDKLDHSVDELKSDMVRVREDMSAILEVLTTMRAGIKFIGYFGFIVKWLGWVAAGFTAIYVFWEKIK